MLRGRDEGGSCTWRIEHYMWKNLVLGGARDEQWVLNLQNWVLLGASEKGEPWRGGGCWRWGRRCRGWCAWAIHTSSCGEQKTGSSRRGHGCGDGRNHPRWRKWELVINGGEDCEWVGFVFASCRPWRFWSECATRMCAWCSISRRKWAAPESRVPLALPSLCTPYTCLAAWAVPPLSLTRRRWTNLSSALATTELPEPFNNPVQLAANVCTKLPFFQGCSSSKTCVDILSREFRTFREDLILSFGFSVQIACYCSIWDFVQLYVALMQLPFPRFVFRNLSSYSRENFEPSEKNLSSQFRFPSPDCVQSYVAFVVRLQIEIFQTTETFWSGIVLSVFFFFVVVWQPPSDGADWQQFKIPDRDFADLMFSHVSA